MWPFKKKEKTNQLASTSIDRWDWHYDTVIEMGLKEEAAATHIGMYLAWIIKNDLFCKDHLEHNPEQIQSVKQGKMTGRQFFMDICDGKFWGGNDLNEEGLAFTKHYYTDERYIIDYNSVFGKGDDRGNPNYNVQNTWENYQLIAKKLDERFAEWKGVNK